MYLTEPNSFRNQCVFILHFGFFYFIKVSIEVSVKLALVAHKYGIPSVAHGELCAVGISKATATRKF